MINRSTVMFVVYGVIAFAAFVTLFTFGVAKWSDFQDARERAQQRESFVPLTEEDREILFTDLNSFETEDALNAHYQYALGLAVVSDTLYVGKCELLPPVLRIKAGTESIRAVNDSDVSVAIFLENNQYVVHSRSETHFKLPTILEGQPRLAGYSCSREDGLFQEARGMLIVPPKIFF